MPPPPPTPLSSLGTTTPTKANLSLDEFHKAIRNSVDYSAARLPSSIRLPALTAYTENGINSFDDLLKLTPVERQLLFQKKMGLNLDTIMAFTHYLQLRQRHFISYAYQLTTPETATSTPTNLMSWRGTSTNTSRTEFGAVGLRNQGSTCYLNAFLQSLYHLSCFRTAVYRVPTEGLHENTGGATSQSASSVMLSLQRLFYTMEYGDTAADTTDLTTSFGWSASDSFVQHDTHEFASKLLDNLEDKFKKHAGLENVIQQLFGGEVVNYVTCINVDYSFSRMEKFYDLQLIVRDHETIYEAFDSRFAKDEILDGKNKYCLEKDGTKTYEDARMGSKLTKVPPVLLLHLNRVDYDMETGDVTKLTSKFEYYMTLQLDKYMDKEGMASKGVSSTDGSLPSEHTNANSLSTEYELFSVLVHSGTKPHVGHYYAYIYTYVPNGEKTWLCFNDDDVRKSALTDVFEQNFGGKKQPTSQVHGTTNAYVLTYINKSVLEEILPKDQSQRPEHLRLFFEKEAALRAQRKHEAEEISYRIKICLVLASKMTEVNLKSSANDNFSPYITTSEYVNDETSVTVRKSDTMNTFFQQMRAKVKDSVEGATSNARLTVWAYDYVVGNFVRRLSLTPEDNDLVNDVFHAVHTTHHYQTTYSQVLLAVSSTPPLIPVTPPATPTQSKEKPPFQPIVPVLVFLKVFDPTALTVVFYGPVVVTYACEIEGFVVTRFPRPVPESEDIQVDFIVEKAIVEPSPNGTVNTTTSSSTMNTSSSRDNLSSAGRSSTPPPHAPIKPQASLLVYNSHNAVFASVALCTQGVKDGDVLFCSFAKYSTIEGSRTAMDRFPTASAYQLYNKKKRMIQLYYLSAPQTQIGTVELLIDYSYSEVQVAVAAALPEESLPSDCLRFWVPSSIQGKRRALSTKDNKSLQTMLLPSLYAAHAKNESTCLYIENVSPYRVSDLDNAHTLRFEYCPRNNGEALQSYIVVLPSAMSCTNEDVWTAIRQRIPKDVNPCKLRLVEEFMGKLVPESELVEGEVTTGAIRVIFSDTNHYRVEPVPEIVPGHGIDSQHKVDCFHCQYQSFTGSTYKTISAYGQPFSLYFLSLDTAETFLRRVHQTLDLKPDTLPQVLGWSVHVWNPSVIDALLPVGAGDILFDAMESCNRSRYQRSKALVIALVHVPGENGSIVVSTTPGPPATGKVKAPPPKPQQKELKILN